MVDSIRFARYYEKGSLYDYDMSQMSILIKDEQNKKVIANILYHRFYDRYLKLFFYNSSIKASYSKKEKTEIRNQFNTEFKSGFIIMANSCLVIELISNFLSGVDKTKKSGGKTFEFVFKKAKEYNNSLNQFSEQPIYGKVRNGLLHQGETYGKFRITRDSKAELFNKNERTINATLFVKALKAFLKSYKKELECEDWNSEIWKNCRTKIEYIIKNSSK
jgi:hypothetical protein